jgi:hypothetical protein
LRPGRQSLNDDDQDLIIPDADETRRRPDRNYPEQLASFLSDIRDTAQLLEKYEADLIRLDHTLYENLQISILGRRAALEVLLGAGEGRLSIEKLKELHSLYTGLVAATSGCKDRLQAALLKCKPSGKPKHIAKFLILGR